LTAGEDPGYNASALERSEAPCARTVLARDAWCTTRLSEFPIGPHNEEIAAKTTTAMKRLIASLTSLTFVAAAAGADEDEEIFETGDH